MTTVVESMSYGHTRTEVGGDAPASHPPEVFGGHAVKTE